MLHCISPNSSITRAIPSDSLVSYPGHWLGESYSSAEIQSVYSAVLADWAKQVLYCRTTSGIWKMNRGIYNMVNFRNLCFASLNGVMCRKSNKKTFLFVEKCWKDPYNQARSGRSKYVDCKGFLKAREANPVSRARRLTSDFCISQSSVVGHIHNVSKSLRSWPNCASLYLIIARLFTHTSKIKEYIILQDFLKFRLS